MRMDVVDDDSSFANITIPEIPEDLNGIEKEKSCSQSLVPNSRLVLKVGARICMRKNMRMKHTLAIE